ncbi:MAG: hypothetical protein MUC60_07175 [Oscillatoria sp. Prado101]|jgi:hypothetical protein|nr:hypothetical protein [Oscillatoria sp. Prado101]
MPVRGEISARLLNRLSSILPEKQLGLSPSLTASRILLPVRSLLVQTTRKSALVVNSLATIQEFVDNLRQAGVDLVVVSAHWGPNMVISPPPHFRNARPRSLRLRR